MKLACNLIQLECNLSVERYSDELYLKHKGMVIWPGKKYKGGISIPLNTCMHDPAPSEIILQLWDFNRFFRDYRIGEFVLVCIEPGFFRTDLKRFGEIGRPRYSLEYEVRQVAPSTPAQAIISETPKINIKTIL